MTTVATATQGAAEGGDLVSTQGSRSAGPTHPEVLTPVVVQLPQPGGVMVEVVSRVLDLEEPEPSTEGAPPAAASVVIARPDVNGLDGAGSLPRSGEELVLAWTHESGQMQLPVTAEAGRRSYGPVWVLTPAGAARRLQRREYFRVPLAVPVLLTPIDDASTTGRVPGTVVDIGEGGLLAVVQGEPPAPDTEVEVYLRLGEEILTPTAVVVRHVTLPGGGQGVALRFADPDEHGDDIRRAAFAEQRRLTAGRAADD